MGLIPGSGQHAVGDPLDRALYDEFMALYNEIDRKMREDLGERNEGRYFMDVVERYAGRYPQFEAVTRDLRGFAQLRNVVAHNLDPRNPWFVPSKESIAGLRRIRDRLVSPVRAEQAFRKVVRTLTPDAPISIALELARTNHYSQFPIYGEQGFLGLLSENGIVQWIARNVERDDWLLGLREHPVSEVLEHEESRPTTRFVARDETADAVVYLFRENPEIVAVIVTQNGKPTEKPIGLAVAEDIARMEQP